MNPPSAPQPPELVAASSSPLTLVGQRASVEAPVASKARPTLQAAVDDTSHQQRIWVHVRDIEAEANPGIVYGVYLNLPDDVTGEAAEAYHVGNVTLFGITQMNDPDDRHSHADGLLHAFDVTRQVEALQAADRWDPQEVTITFEPILPLPPPFDPETDTPAQREARAEFVAAAAEEQRRWGEAVPVTIGSVGLFVG